MARHVTLDYIRDNGTVNVNQFLQRAPTITSEKPVRAFIEKLEAVTKVKNKVVLCLHEYDITAKGHFEQILVNATRMLQTLKDRGAEEIVFLHGIDVPDETDSHTARRCRVNEFYSTNLPMHFGNSLRIVSYPEFRKLAKLAIGKKAWDYVRDSCCKYFLKSNRASTVARIIVPLLENHIPNRNQNVARYQPDPTDLASNQDEDLDETVEYQDEPS